MGERAVLWLRLLSPLSLSVGQRVTILLFFYIISYRNHSRNQSVAFNPNIYTTYGKYIYTKLKYICFCICTYILQQRRAASKENAPAAELFPYRKLLPFESYVLFQVCSNSVLVIIILCMMTSSITKMRSPIRLEEPQDRR